MAHRIDRNRRWAAAGAAGLGLLHALVADEAIVPMWVVDLRVSSEP